MTETEVWQQIEQYAIEGNWTGVGVLGDWLQEKGIAEGETVCWWAKQPEPESWLYYASQYSPTERVPGNWAVVGPALYPLQGVGFLKDVVKGVHRHRIRLKALLT